jgi:Fe-S-cluster containining protein
MLTRKTKLSEVLELSKDCKKCGKCCAFGSGFLLDEDVSRIAKFLKIPEKEFIEKYLEKKEMYGKEIHKIKGNPCMFLEKDKCKIHEAKPLNCRIATCKPAGEEISVWFMLNHLVDEKNPQSIRDWKVCIECGGKNIPGGKLEEIVPDKERLRRILNYEIL